MKFVIVTGAARSGTTFLANLLDRASGVEARHMFFARQTPPNESYARNTFVTLSYYQPGHPLLEQILRREREQVAARFPHARTFVDVNPQLQYALDAVRATLSDVLCFQLVRNGREVVRSLFNSARYTARYRDLWILPSDASALARWSGYSRFERICWYWNDMVARLLEARVRTLQLERIVSDYRYLGEYLLEPCGIDLDEEVWRTLKDTRLHPSRFHLKRFLRGRPVKLAWAQQHEASFMRICGDTMRALGYE